MTWAGQKDRSMEEDRRLVRIDVAAFEGLLAASGIDGWFVEPLKWLEEY